MAGQSNSEILPENTRRLLESIPPSKLAEYGFGKENETETVAEEVLPERGTERSASDGNYIIPEVVGAPTIQGGILVHARNVPPAKEQRKVDSWYVPAHCPVFLTDEARSIGVNDNVVDVSALAIGSWDHGVAGVSIDGLYDAQMQRDHFGSDGIGRFSMAIGGLVTVAAHPETAMKFNYGDKVYVTSKPCTVDRLQDTSFKCHMDYANFGEPEHLLGTFVAPVDAYCGGMRVMLTIGGDVRPGAPTGKYYVTDNISEADNGDY